MKEIKKIILNKNRGWRGLAELKCLDDEGNTVHTMIFSFSPDMWQDLLKGYIVIQDDNNYYVLNFDTTSGLPRPTQQRSVLIKDFKTKINDVMVYSKFGLTMLTPLSVTHFIKNKNNHTTSDWNCIGLRVIPTI